MIRPSLKPISAKALWGAKSVPDTQSPADQQNALLVANNIEVSYGATQVLWGVKFSIAKGKVTCIIGSNGAGKTTTLNTIAGVLRNKKGQLLLNGEDISALSTRERVKRHTRLVP